MGSTDTLQGLQGQEAQAPANSPEIAAEARELFTKDDGPPPLSVGFCAVDPPYHRALLAFAGALMEMGLKVSIDTTHGPHPLTGEHMTYYRCDGFPNV